MDDKESEHHTVLKADFSQFEHEVNRIVVARAFPTLRRIDEASDSDNDEAGPQTISYQERQRARVAVAAQARAHLPSHKNTKFVVVPSTTDASDSKKSTESTIPVQDHAMETVDTSGPSASAPAAPALPPPISAAPPPAPIGVGDKARKMLNLIPSTPMIGSQIVTLLAQNANASVDVVNDEFRRADASSKLGSLFQLLGSGKSEELDSVINKQRVSDKIQARMNKFATNEQTHAKVADAAKRLSALSAMSAFDD